MGGSDCGSVCGAAMKKDRIVLSLDGKRMRRHLAWHHDIYSAETDDRYPTICMADDNGKYGIIDGDNAVMMEESVAALFVEVYKAQQWRKERGLKLKEKR